MTRSSALVEGIQALWKEGLLTDITLEVDNQQFKCHKSILISASKFFQDKCAMKSEVTSVKIEGYCPATVSKVLGYIYGENVNLDTAELEACTRYLELSTAVEPAEAFAEAIMDQWENKQYLDYTIMVEDQSFRVHHIVVAAMSWYFRAILTSEMVESQADSITLKGLEADSVAKVIELMYKGNFSEDMNVEEIFDCAEYLQADYVMKGIEDMLEEKLTQDNTEYTLDIFARHILKVSPEEAMLHIEQKLLQNLNAENCFKVLSVCTELCREEGIQRSKLFIKLNFSKILKAYPPKECTLETIVHLAENWPKAEWDLLQAIGHWLQVDYEDRKQHLAKVSGLLRFALLKPKELTALKMHKKEVYQDLVKQNKDQIAQAEEYHKLPVNQKIIFNSEQNQIRGPPNPYLFTLAADMHVTVDDETSWRPYKTKNKLVRGVTDLICNMFVVNGFLMVTYFTDECGPLTGKMYVFDPRLRVWSQLAPMKQVRAGAATAYHQDHLYMIGGTAVGGHASDTIDEYSFRTGSWKTIEEKLPILLKKVCAVTIDSNLFIGAGHIRGEKKAIVSSDSDPNRKMFGYNFTTKQWSEKAGLPTGVAVGFRSIHLGEESGLWAECKGAEIDFYTIATDQWSKYQLATDCPLKFGIQNTIDQMGNIIFLAERTPCKPDRKNKDLCYYNRFGLWLVSAGGKKVTEFSFDDHHTFDRGTKILHLPCLLSTCQTIANLGANA